ncbi:Aste57867_11216 [Aphanomyces stellatus]|uniref:Aste57867_11216 protein n=1 Tax=Aphanomyces stellatus TaxID=120398 RepID=A0A485KU84_9STRA|nr:hypothetical protein As57867_011174 [Aphanomyces stellatus]VFT88082.1 Aste57867_11216 [Aphanomyces stellatus]
MSNQDDFVLKVNELYWKQTGANEWVLGQLCAFDHITSSSASIALVDEATGSVLPNTESAVDVSTTALRPANPLFTTSADMTALRYLHEAALVKNLHDRWIIDDRQPYTSMSNVLIAVNPLRYLKKAEKAKYVRQSLDKSPPHPFHVAEVTSLDNAYRQLRSVKQNQSIIISGESGSGKTETSKIILDFLTDRSRFNQSTADHDAANQQTQQEHALGDRLMDTIPILESFGNAKTHRNHNSSRFGKYMRLQFSPSTSDGPNALLLTGASIDTYLLETSRVVLPPAGERNFHIFYELLRSGDAALLNDLKLVPTPYGAVGSDDEACLESFVYLNRSGCTANAFIDDRANFDKLVAALECVNIDTTELFRVVSGVLHLGNMVFDEEDTQEGTTASVSNEHRDGAVSIAAELLGLDPMDLMDAILTKKISRMANDNVNAKLTGRPGLQREASVYFVKKDLRQASYSRDTIAKIIYDQVFGALMRHCADALAYNVALKDELPYIGVLDIFGFEDFEPKNRNSLEQLLINYANESLQSMFNQCILKAEQELYQNEHIWAPENASLMFPFACAKVLTTELVLNHQPHQLISYDDNKECLTLMAGKNEGMFSVIDTVGKLAGPTDRKLIERFHTLFKKHPCFVQPHPKDMTHTFCIRHFAGVVRYRIDSFIDKNSNIASIQFEELIQSSSLSILSTAFDTPNTPTTAVAPARRGGSSNKNSGSVSHMFSLQMKGLMAELESTRNNFIRCIKPNAAMDAAIFDRASVLEQLRCSGTIQACQVLQVGLPTRVTFEEIVDIYTGLLTDDFMFKFHANARLFTQALCHVLAFPTDAYRLGDTRLFFKTGKIHMLDAILNITPAMAPEALKARLVQYLVKRRWVTSVTKVAVSRHVQALLVTVQLKRRAIVIQCWYRQHLAKRRVEQLRKERRVADAWARLSKKANVRAAFDGANDDKLSLLQALMRQRTVPPRAKWLLTWLGPMQRAMYVQRLGKAACMAYLAKRAFLGLLDRVRMQRASVTIQSQIRRVLATKRVEALRKQARATQLWRRVRIRVKATIWFFALFRRAHVRTLERDNARLADENERLRAENAALAHQSRRSSGNYNNDTNDVVVSLEAQLKQLQDQLQEALQRANDKGVAVDGGGKAFSSVETSSSASSVRHNDNPETLIGAVQEWLTQNSLPEPLPEELTLQQLNLDGSVHAMRMLSRGGSSSLKLRRFDSDVTVLLQREVEQSQELTKKIRTLVLKCNWYP